MQPSPETRPPTSQDPAERDRITLRMMGVFFCGFALLTMAGMFWEQTGVERMVNAGAGLVLLGVGLGALKLAGRNPS